LTGNRSLIIDTHCHVVVAEMTAGTVPEHWRPVVTRDNGRYRLGFRGREINSVTGEFTDVAAMLAEAAATGIGHLLLSPWITAVPVDAEPRGARLVCQGQNAALAAAAAAHPGRVSAVGAVALQDPALAARQLAELVTIPGLRGVEIPTSVGGRYLGDDFFGPFWESAEAGRARGFLPSDPRGFRGPALDG